VSYLLPERGLHVRDLFAERFESVILESHPYLPDFRIDLRRRQISHLHDELLNIVRELVELIVGMLQAASGAGRHDNDDYGSHQKGHQPYVESSQLYGAHLGIIPVRIEINGDYSGDFVDWGATMGAGWRTLTSDEWAYLLKTRSASTVNGTENGRYAKAKVNDVGGVILFPDTYTHPDGVAAPTGVNATDEYGWEGNSYTAADWTKMESAGCVFLPAAGCRYGSEMIGLGSYGYYGSATPDGADYAYRVKFNSGSLEPANSINRCLGCSVRLVQEVAPNP
jgi:hypothetical protein